MRLPAGGGRGLPWGGAPGETMLATLRGGIQSLSPCPGGGIQSLSPLRGGPRSPGIQSASDRGGPGNLPGKPGPTGLGPKPWRRPLLRPREATLRDVLHRGWCRTLYGKTTDHRMLLTRSFHKERFPRYSGYSREMAPIHDWYSSYIAKGSFPWQHGARGHRGNGLV